MKTDDFIMRTKIFTPNFPVFDADGDEVKIEVNRTRNNRGCACITVCVGASRIQLDSGLQSDQEFSDYNTVARALAELILEAVADGCPLPTQGDLK